jgi:hypothetical protein
VTSATLAGILNPVVSTTKSLAMTLTHKSLIAATATALVGLAVYHTLGTANPGGATDVDRMTSLESGAEPRTAEKNGVGTDSRASRTAANDATRREDLARKNAALRKELAREKAVRAFFEQQYKFHNEMSAKLASDTLPTPKTEADVAILMGRFHRASVDFERKWGLKSPADGTPEAEEHSRELDQLTTYAATFRKVMESGIDAEGGRDDGFDSDPTPGDIAQMQSLHLLGSLELDETRWQKLDGLLALHYADGFDRKLDLASRPATGAEDWARQREDLSRKAYTEIQALLSEEQRAIFQRLYQPGFFWSLQLGGNVFGPGEGSF